MRRVGGLFYFRGQGDKLLFQFFILVDQKFESWGWQEQGSNYYYWGRQKVGGWVIFSFQVFFLDLIGEDSFSWCYRNEKVVKGEIVKGDVFFVLLLIWVFFLVRCLFIFRFLFFLF